MKRIILCLVCICMMCGFFGTCFSAGPGGTVLLSLGFDSMATNTEAFEIKAYPYPYGAPITVYLGKTIGHKAICRFPTIYTNKIEITFDKNKDVCADIKYIK